MVPIVLMTCVLLNPFGHNDSTTTAPLYHPTTEATTPPTPTPVPVPKRSVERTERPARLDIPTPTPTRSSTTSRTAPTTKPPTPTPTPTLTTPTPTVVVYKSCAEVRAAGKAPLHRGDPGYSAALDRNGDGVACDRGNS